MYLGLVYNSYPVALSAKDNSISSSNFLFVNRPLNQADSCSATREAKVDLVQFLRTPSYEIKRVGCGTNRVSQN